MEESQTVEREISFEEAIDYGIRLQQNGQLDDAADLYRRLMEIAPSHPKVLHYAGVLAHQRGHSDEAIGLIQRSLALEPDHADGHSNLGIVFRATGRIEDAIAAYERAIALDPSHVNAHNNLGVLLKGQGRTAEAEAAYRRAIEINPDYVEAHHNLGILCTSLNRRREAALCHYRVVTLCPQHPEARRLLGMAHSALGEVDKAIAVYKEWLEVEPDNPIVQHMLAACLGKNAPPRASDACIETMFDRFAETFEETLAGLHYQAPRVVAALLEDSVREPSKSLDIADIGCGTGLCGLLIAPYARRLTGVDLSAGMLARAKEKNVYDELVKDELTHYLRSQRAAFDVLVSADTLVYFGDLQEVTAAASGALRPGGVLIFTVEELIDGNDVDFRIETHGRYSHSRGYVERLLNEANLQPDIARAELRLESGLAVAGLAVRATKVNGVSHA